MGLDNRKKKTKRRFQEILLEMLKEKPLEEITVMEFTKRAHIHRATFYRNYRNLEEIKMEIQEDFCRRFKSAIDRYAVELNRKALCNLCLRMLQFVTQNYETCKVLFRNKQGDFSLMPLEQILLDTYCTSKYCNSKLEEYSMVFLFSGILHIMEYWLAGKCKVPIDQLVDYIAQGITDGFPTVKHLSDDTASISQFLHNI